MHSSFQIFSSQVLQDASVLRLRADRIKPSSTERKFQDFRYADTVGQVCARVNMRVLISSSAHESKTSVIRLHAMVMLSPYCYWSLYWNDYHSLTTQTQTHTCNNNTL